MSKKLNLAEISKGKKYQVTGFNEDTSIYADKLNKMGFTIGTAIQRAPVKISDPIVVEIRGSRIALRKKEARQVLVREVYHAQD